MIKPALIVAVFNCLFLEHVYVQASCELPGIPTDTSPSNLYSLPPIADDLEEGVTTWEWPIDGDVDRTTVDSSSDYRYLSAKLEQRKTIYHIYSNQETKNFLIKENKREMTRYINLYCDDTPQTVQKYYFKIPVQDMTPPRFEQDEYSFILTPNWNKERPISEGQFVIVSDNAWELGDPDLNFDLEFEASVAEVITIQPVKLWTEPNLSRYYYRLDLFLHENKDLTPGEELQIILTAKDQFNGGTTKLNLKVM